MNTLKAYGTRSLKRECHLFRRRYWTQRGSKRYLWNSDSVEAAARYTAFMQGERGESYLASELSF
ncbi:MAG: hypothetical protein HYX74_10725 [Acidobacteria bacterium]|nr:hypothetical protein [Acidobacteriota bacterium]